MHIDTQGYVKVSLAYLLDEHAATHREGDVRERGWTMVAQGEVSAPDVEAFAWEVWQDPESEDQWEEDYEACVVVRPLVGDAPPRAVVFINSETTIPRPRVEFRPVGGMRRGLTQEEARRAYPTFVRWDAQTGDYTLASVDGREQTFVLVMHT